MSEQSNNTKHLVIIGSGYAGVSLAQSLREFEKLHTTTTCPLTIHLISNEDFCSRPNLFFRLKFLEWHQKHLDYHAGIHLTPDGFLKKYQIHLIHATVSHINASEQTITFQQSSDSTMEPTLKYDVLCVCTGGKPHIVHYPLINKEQQRLDACTPETHDRIHPQLDNYVVVRNVPQVERVYETLRASYEEDDQQRRVVVIGSGTLGLDIVSHMMEGYMAVENKAATAVSNGKMETVWNIEHVDQLPKMTIIGRGKYLGRSLLGNEVACEMLTKHTRQVYGKYLDLELEEQVDHLQYENSQITHVVTKSGKVIPCCLVIQALGVDCETTLSHSIHASIGQHGGILVNEHFQVMDQNKQIVPNVYCTGDCAEIPIGEMTAVWKNWTGAREESQSCAQSIMMHALGVQCVRQKLVFNQSPKFFGLHITCLGQYHGNDDGMHIIEKVELERNVFTKYVFEKHEKYENMLKLRGALIIGPSMNEYKLGVQVLHLLREDTYVPLSILTLQNNLLTFNMTYWTHLLQAIKKCGHGDELLDESGVVLKEIEKALSAPVEKKVNPLLAKKFANPLLAKKKESASVALVEQSLSNLSLDSKKE